MAEAESSWDELMRTNLSGVPNEVAVEILSRLPVESLIRFKTACKPWCALFGDSNFIEMHLSKGISNKTYCHLLKYLSYPGEEMISLESSDDSEDRMLPQTVQTRVNTIQGCCFYLDELDAFYSLRDKKSFAEIGKLQVPIQSKTYYYLIVESMNGVVCLAETDSQARYPRLNLSLWNPATREFKSLPRFHINRYTGIVRLAAIGFAYHPKINDYKVVRIVRFVQTKAFEVEIFSLNADCWRKVDAQALNHIFLQDYPSKAFVNGALHWTQYKDDENCNPLTSILSFDVCTEKFNQIALPSYSPGYEMAVHRTPETFEGSLSLIAHHAFQICEIWVMKEYGVVESWVKLYSIRQWNLSMRPLGFFDDGNLIIEKRRNKDLVSYDLKMECSRYLHVFGPSRVVKYTESLVPLKSHSRLNWYPSTDPPLY